MKAKSAENSASEISTRKPDDNVDISIPEEEYERAVIPNVAKGYKQKTAISSRYSTNGFQSQINVRESITYRSALQTKMYHLIFSRRKAFEHLKYSCESTVSLLEYIKHRAKSKKL